MFDNKTVDFSKLQKFGFTKENDTYVYSRRLVDSGFILTVEVDCNGNLSSHTIDPDLNEEYSLHLSEECTGGFVGEVRKEVFDVLNAIERECYSQKFFDGNQTQYILDYVKSKYDDELEFLWENSPDSAIIRRKDNQKWYAVFMKVAKCKLVGNSQEKVEVLDLHALPEDVENTVDGKTVFRAYHMNKKHWISVILDGSVSNEKLCDLIDKSYETSKRK